MLILTAFFGLKNQVNQDNQGNQGSDKNQGSKKRSHPTKDYAPSVFDRSWHSTSLVF